MIKAPNINIIHIDAPQVPRVADPEHPTQEELDAINRYLAWRFTGERLTGEVLSLIKGVLVEAGLDPDKYSARFDEDKGELTITPTYMVVEFTVTRHDDEGASKRVCRRWESGGDGCEFNDNGVCRGVVYPTYPPQYDDCIFHSKGNRGGGLWKL